jgi:hypothetical protein
METPDTVDLLQASVGAEISKSLGESQSRTAKLILEQEEPEGEQEIFFGALFNLEHSPAFKFLEQKRARKEMPEKR